MVEAWVGHSSAHMLVLTYSGVMSQQLLLSPSASEALALESL